MPIAEVNGTRLYYEARGPGAARGRPLLFCHGFTLDHRMWKRQLEGLSDRYRVVAYDCRGFGRSAMPVLGERFKHCEDAAALSEHLFGRSEADKVVAIGHSIGAHHLLELAVSRPDLVAGFISICASGLAVIPFPEEIQKTFAAIKGAIASAGADVDAGVVAAKHIWSACAWFTSNPDLPMAAKKEIDAMLADYTGWQWTHDNPVDNITPPLAERLEEVRAPALVITGDRDIPYNDTVGNVLSTRIPKALRIKLPNAGHMANMEQPEAVNQAISEFVDGL